MQKEIPQILKHISKHLSVMEQQPKRKKNSISWIGVYFPTTELTKVLEEASHLKDWDISKFSFSTEVIKGRALSYRFKFTIQEIRARA